MTHKPENIPSALRIAHEFADLMTGTEFTRQQVEKFDELLKILNGENKFQPPQPAIPVTEGEEETYWIDYGNDGEWLTAKKMQEDYQELLESTESEPPKQPEGEMVRKELLIDYQKICVNHEKRIVELNQEIAALKATDTGKELLQELIDWDNAYGIYDESGYGGSMTKSIRLNALISDIKAALSSSPSGGEESWPFVNTSRRPDLSKLDLPQPSGPSEEEIKMAALNFSDGRDHFSEGMNNAFKKGIQWLSSYRGK